MKKLLIVGLISIPISLWAKNVTHQCECDVNDVVDVNMEIKIEVNQNVDRWESGDTVTVYDSNEFHVYEYRTGSGDFFPTGAGGDACDLPEAPASCGEPDPPGEDDV